jgi:PBP1b-binding outer membrane lipoprotein LpoB
MLQSSHISKLSWNGSNERVVAQKSNNKIKNDIIIIKLILQMLQSSHISKLSWNGSTELVGAQISKTRFNVS